MNVKVVYTVICIGANLVIWFGGWSLYSMMEIWKTTTNIEYQNILFAIMGFSIIVYSTFLVYPLMKKYKSETHHTSIQTPTESQDLKEVKQSLSEINEKISDLHAFRAIITKQTENPKTDELEKKLQDIEKQISNIEILEKIENDQGKPLLQKKEQDKGGKTKRA